MFILKKMLVELEKLISITSPCCLSYVLFQTGKMFEFINFKIGEGCASSFGPVLIVNKSVCHVN